ncbi:MAG: hypothetical protein ACREMA_00930 [Longimicrobiales bacterium]
MPTCLARAQCYVPKFLCNERADAPAGQGATTKAEQRYFEELELEGIDRLYL